jgi:hypothetical protein
MSSLTDSFIDADVDVGPSKSGFPKKKKKKVKKSKNSLVEEEQERLNQTMVE